MSDDTITATESERWRDPSLPVDERVAALMSGMTLTEKLAQLGSYWPKNLVEEGEFGDVAPLESEMSEQGQSFEAAAAEGLGHLTRVFGSVPVDPEEGVANLRRYQRHLRENTRLGIPAIAHEESLTGFTTLGATVYPTATAWGATFSPELVERMASAIGDDLRSVGVQQSLSPLLDVVRDYRWGRVEECIGEDPYLVGMLGTAYVRGLEKAGIIATLKHFAGYSASRAGRNHAPVPMGRREMADVILPPFEMAVRLGGVRSVMNSYTDVDGEPVATSTELLTKVLRDQWGFDGTVVSDYWSINFVHTMHRVGEDVAAAGAATLRAGLDVELPETSAYRAIARLVESGELDERLVDRSLERVLRQKADLGMLDPGWKPPAKDGPIDLDSPRNREIARELAEKSVVLLANDGVLPVRSAPARIALLGPSATEPRTMLGCYSFPNHVMSRLGDEGTGIPVPTIADAIRSEFPDAELRVVKGVEISGGDTGGIPEAVEAARNADLAIVTVGDLAGLFGRGTSGEACDAIDLRLPGHQSEFLSAILDTGTPTVLVVVSGRPYALGDYAERAAAIVQAFLPGSEGAAALSGVLSGRVTPSGKLPVGVPSHHGGQPGTYLAPILGRFSKGVSNLDPTPLYPFGHGISYTTFEYSDLSLSASAVEATGALTVSAVIRNTGDVAGEEVVQLYLSDEYAQVARPVRQLTGFTRVALAPGEAARVSFELSADLTSFTGVDYRRIVEPGSFRVWVAASSEDLRLEGTFAVTGDLRIVEGERVMVAPATVSPL
ncbi:glycoside hydrolase family 3 N-terminal domain-containing protein [Naasia sp. SYSU D00948]|uniref:beta-glucosidase family protein n=1 Tax=Naasia sp. SYSU D00948 TaxID=2817379 RepID=UPI0027DC26BF|nr:glycoside hydrolase family 3 N-terminal domain-containing protein [Naasia sp. SYSU D00948]